MWVDNCKLLGESEEFVAIRDTWASNSVPVGEADDATAIGTVIAGRRGKRTAALQAVSGVLEASGREAFAADAKRSKRKRG